MIANRLLNAPALALILLTLVSIREVSAQSLDSGNSYAKDGYMLFESHSDRQSRYAYRIPAAVTVNANGKIVVFAEQRVGNNHDYGDINIVARISDDNGDTWRPGMEVICELHEDTCGNPTAVVDQTDGTIHLFMIQSPGDHCQTQAQLKNNDDCIARYSLGDRKIFYQVLKFNAAGELVTHALPKDLTKTLQPDDDVFAFDFVGPGAGIQLTLGEAHKNRLIVPAKHRNFIKDPDDSAWRLSKGFVSEETSETSIVELDSGIVLRNDRPTSSYVENNPSRRLISTSDDGGDTFGPTAPDDALYDPRMQGSMLRYSKGKIFFANCSTSGATGRRGIKLRVRKVNSEDEAGNVIWSDRRLLDEECGYSSLTKSRDWRVVIVNEERQPGTNAAEGNLQNIFVRKRRLSFWDGS